ncbi:fimbrial protein [Burkholderia latens]|uniref:fimbrial protein n=1 Tax=Burkholderia latens TaxID=488446 RepID=UPI001FD7C79F|nr:fimbrial protein [Burkholderia latens]
MNKMLVSKTRRYSLYRFCALSIACLAIGCAKPGAAYAALCGYVQNEGPQSMEFTVPTDLVVPRDAPVGAVVWVSEGIPAPNQNRFNCRGDFKHGMVNSVGAAASAVTSADLPIGKTGLAWSFDESDQPGLPDIAFASAISNPSSQTTWGWLSKPMTLRIKKIGPVEPGASVPSGILGYITVENQIKPITVKTRNQSSVATLSCKTPVVNVSMGDQNYVGQFKGIGSSLAPVSFSIALKECPEGISKVSYQLNPNTTIVDATRSVVALDADSTAKGVGLQLLDSSGNPIALKTKLQYSDYDKLGGNFNIPLKAAYRQTAATLVPGTANTSVTFVMTYD